MCPNLECILPRPIIILCSFKKLTYGKWYNAASGRFIFAYTSNKVEIIAMMKLYFINFLLKNFLRSVKNKKKVKHKIIVFKYIFKGNKKFKKRAINETKMIPNKVIFPISYVCNCLLKLLSLYENRYP